jgi:hypothetical protein
MIQFNFDGELGKVSHLPNQLSDLLLHNLSHHTNLSRPYSKYIKSTDVFPKQNTELLDKLIMLRYIDGYRAHSMRDVVSAGRPYDDSDFNPDVDLNDEVDDPTQDYANNITSDMFWVVRADAEAPYKLIAISVDYNVILINRSDKNQKTNDYFFNEIVSVYPQQRNDLIGLIGNNQYPGDKKENKSYVLRVDAGEPCESVILEQCGDTMRFLLGSEVYTSITERYTVYQRDINGNLKDGDGIPPYHADNGAMEHPDNPPLDADGNEVDDPSGASQSSTEYIMANGGPAYTMTFGKSDYIDDQYIPNVREELVDRLYQGGLKLYGTIDS